MKNYKVFKVGNGDYEYIAAQTKEEAISDHLYRIGSDWYDTDEEIGATVIDFNEVGFFEKEDGIGYEELTWEKWMEGFIYEKPTLLCWNE